MNSWVNSQRLQTSGPEDVQTPNYSPTIHQHPVWFWGKHPKTIHWETLAVVFVLCISPGNVNPFLLPHHLPHEVCKNNQENILTTVATEWPFT